jgi:hypothetical protein
MSTESMKINMWFDEGVQLKRDYMIVVCDTFDYENYPIFVDTKDFDQVYAEYSKNMQRIMEVYNLHMNKETQLLETRTWHFLDGCMK